MKKITTTKTFKYDADGRIIEETVTTVEETRPDYVYTYPYPYTYPYTVWSSGSLTTGTTYTTWNQTPPASEK